MLEVLEQTAVFTKEFDLLDTCPRENLDILGGADKIYDFTSVQKFTLVKKTYRGRLRVEEGRRMHDIFEKFERTCIDYSYQFTLVTIPFFVCEFKDAPHLRAFLGAKVHETLGKVPKSV